MITTKDVKTKDTKPEKLTILTTGKHKPKEFVIAGGAKPRDKRMITTSNVEQFQREQKLLSDEEKKFAAKAKRAIAARARKEKAEKAKVEKDKKK